MNTQDLEKELRHKTEELDRIKEVLAIYLDKVYYELDDITPEDLERKFRDYDTIIQKQADVHIHNTPDLEIALNAPIWVMEIEQLCRDLGWTEFTGVNRLQNIKLFIKSLARENFRFKLMVGDKQTDGDTRTNNWGSSDTATNK